MNNKVPRTFAICRILTNRMVRKYRKFLRSITKIAIKYENIVPYGGVFYVMNGLEQLRNQENSKS